MILVTGGTGFIGRYLLQGLVAKGEPVRAIKRSAPVIPLAKDIASKIEWVEGDVLDITSMEEAMNGCNKVYHCAAVVSFQPKDAKQMHQINVTGTANVVNTALQAGIKKMVHISSIAAIGRSLMNNQVTEETKWEKNKLNSRYAISKHLSEMEVWRGIAEGLNAVIVNPSVVLGPGDWHKGTCKIFSDSYKGIPAYTGGATGFVDVRDVAAIMIQLMEGKWSAERFIVNGENLSYKEILFSIADNFGKPRPGIQANRFMSEVAWRAFAIRSWLTGKEPLVTKETARVATREFFFDNTKVRDALGYNFTPLSKTIEWTCAEFIKENKQVNLIKA